MSVEPIEHLKAELKNSSGIEFFNKLEKHVGFHIPINLKHILTLNAYSTAYAISTLDDDAIEEIENFMKNDFTKDMVQKQCTMKYYLGVYENCQSKFKVSSGDRRFLSTISRACKSLFIDQCQQSSIRSRYSLIPNEIVSSPDRLMDFQILRMSSAKDEFETLGSAEMSNDGEETLFREIGAHMITVFNDAKRTSLSAWHWPSRFVAYMIANNYRTTGDTSTDINLQYVTPTNHSEFIDCIVQTDLDNVNEILRNSLAVSLRVDGSTDRSLHHNVYVMASVIKSDATITTLFMGFKIPNKSKALGYFECVKCVGDCINPWYEFFNLVTSIVTDGEYLNTGRIQGLCVKLTEERINSMVELPLISIWCIGHRINLAWKAICKIKSIADLIKIIREMCAYFRKSGKRTRKLKDIAAANNLPRPLRYPAYFEIRWSEFTFNLFYAVLRNWRSSIRYFESENLETEMKRWLLYDRLHLLTFLADVLNLLKSFQKFCQSDTISILDVVQKKVNFLNRLQGCKSAPIVGGWEELFLKEVEISDNNYFLHGNKLTKMKPTSSRRLGYSFTIAQRHLIIDKLIGHVKIRLGVDEPLQNKLSPLANFNANTPHDSLALCHATIIPDTNKNVFIAEYNEVLSLLVDYESTTTLCTLQKLHKDFPNDFASVKCALARVGAAKPHSADVERLISKSNYEQNANYALLHFFGSLRRRFFLFIR